MGSEIPITFFELCRLCLEKAGEVNIFNTEDLVEDIFTCTSVKVSVKEKLPSKICLKCQETIYSAKNLRIIALKNNVHLHSLFGEEDDDSTDEQCNESVHHTLYESNRTGTELKRRFVFEEDENNDHIYKKQMKDRRQSSEYSEKSLGLKAPISISVRKDIFESTSTVSSSTNPNDDPLFTETIDSKESSKLTEFECSFCQKTFGTKKKYNIHKRTHFKNLFCPLDMCGKKFATKGDVEKHIRTHTGERPYQCEVCEKGFAQRGTLKAHRDAVHGGGSFIIGK